MLYDKPIALFDLRLTPIPAGGKVLDIGFGFGENIVDFAKHGFAAYALDNSDELLDNLRRRVVDEHVQIDITKSEATTLPYPDQTFDLVILTEVLEHVREYPALVKEIRRVLKDGAVAIISVPTNSTEKVYTWLHKNYFTNATHVNLFKKSFLRNFFTGSGFDVVTVKNENFRPAVFWLFNAAFHARHNYVGVQSSHPTFEKGFHRFWAALDKIKIGYAIEAVGKTFWAKSQYYYLRKKG